MGLDAPGEQLASPTEARMVKAIVTDPPFGERFQAASVSESFPGDGLVLLSEGEHLRGFCGCRGFLPPAVPIVYKTVYKATRLQGPQKSLAASCLPARLYVSWGIRI